MLAERRLAKCRRTRAGRFPERPDLAPAKGRRGGEKPRTLKDGRFGVCLEAPVRAAGGNLLHPHPRLPPAFHSREFRLYDPDDQAVQVVHRELLHAVGRV